MKKIYPLFFPVILALTGCGGSRHIYFDAQVPAPFTIPRHIRSLAIIDRSVPEDERMNILEGVLTGEGIRQDMLATQIVLDGLNQSLKNSSRYVVTRTTEKMKGSGTGSTYPEPLEWQKVKELCEQYNADALVSLETYDSDFIITGGTATKGEGGKKIFASGVATVNCGFRLYDPATRNITDQYHFSHMEPWESGGNALVAALGTLANRDAAIRNASFRAGVIYGERITPSWVSIDRDYYRKSKRDAFLAEGARMMEVNDWDRAIEALEKAVETGYIKTKGRAAHNLAVVYEILGNLEEAREWASDAWGIYGNKRSKEYGYILTRRISQQNLLNEQIGH